MLQSRPNGTWSRNREAAKNGADGRNRTADLLITNQLLYRLSYIGRKAVIIVMWPMSGLVQDTSRSVPACIETIGGRRENRFPAEHDVAHQAGRGGAEYHTVAKMAGIQVEPLYAGNRADIGDAMG
jgi:hypothetical protein